MNTFANLKIGKKLAVVFGSAMLLIAAVGVLGIWSLRSVEKAEQQSQFETENSFLAKEFDEDTKRLMLHAATALIRGESTEEDAARVDELRKSYGAVLAKLRVRVTADEGKRLMGIWEGQTAAPKAANQRAAELNKHGKHAEAAKVFIEQSMVGHEAQVKTIQEFLRWQDAQVPKSMRRGRA